MASLKNTSQEYGSVAKLFHWVMAILIIGLLILGNIMGDLPNEMKPNAYMLHKSLGILILALVFVRYGWRLVNKQPELDANYSKWIKLGAKLGHIGLYVLMFAMPISGWVFAASAERSLTFFNLFELPILTTDKSIKGIANDIHGLAANAMIALISVHILAGFYHHYKLKDNVLKRMLLSCCRR